MKRYRHERRTGRAGSALAIAMTASAIVLAVALAHGCSQPADTTRRPSSSTVAREADAPSPAAPRPAAPRPPVAQPAAPPPKPVVEAAPPTETGGLAAHESFAYDAERLAGSDGGMGWAGPWKDSPGRLTPGVSLWNEAGDTIAASGGYYSSTNDNWRATRKLAAPVGDRPGTTWVSFFIRNDTGSKKETYGFLGLVDKDGKGVKFGQGHWGATWSLMEPGDAKTTTSSNNKRSQFVVLRVDVADGEGADAVRAYVNPRPGTPPTDPAALKTGIDLPTLDTVILQSGTSGTPFSYDEIRIGATYASVTPRVEGGRPADADANDLGSEWGGAVAVTRIQSTSHWVVRPGGSDSLRIELKNDADREWRGIVRVELCDADGRPVDAHEQKARVAAGATATASQALSLAKCEAGEHLVRVRLLRGARGNRRQDAGCERSLAVASDEHAFILFEREPVARGLEFDRTNLAPAQITARGLSRWIWRAHWRTAEQGWWRSVRMSFTDDAFRNGAAPVVDIDIRFRQPAEAPVNVSVNRRDGNGAVSSGWGGRGKDYVKDPPIKRLFAQVDDAKFDRGKRDDLPKENAANGCDIRYNACTADGEIRSIFVKRYDLTGDVDWSRLLRRTGVDLGRTNFVFEPGTRVNARVKLRNRARVPFRSRASVTLSTAYDELLWEKTHSLTIPPESDDALAVPIETADMRYGVYILRTAIGDHGSTETLFAVSDTDEIPHAKDGEFLYGTDAGGSYDKGYNLDWAEFMGMDMIRNCARGGQLDRKSLTAAVAELKRRGLRGHIMMDPGWHPKPDERAKKNAEIVEFLSWAAKTHGEFLKWYELGNEPDLPFFYAGPTDAYVEGYKPMYRAVKANDPDSVVMNGGLCFHGKDGNRRAHELVRKLPGEMVDAWAYHGHGPGAQAERNAWNRQDEAVRAVGKGDRDYIETESGLFANDPATWRRQAQTIVEKVVFAQSKGAPTFFWFNLHMGGGDWGYTTVEREHEPRPAVLAHRTMAKHLKGLKHAYGLDLAASRSEAHLFAAPDSRRALVLWSDRGEITRTIDVGPGCTRLRRIDLYGNASPAVEAAPGLVQMSIDADPVYLTWSTGDPKHRVHVPPPPLSLPDKLRVVPGRAARLPVTVRNPTASLLSTTLRFTTVGEAPVEVASAAPRLDVPARGSKTATVEIDVKAVTPSLWPRQWTVFVPVPGDVDLAGFRDIPSSIESRGHTLRPRVGIPDGCDLDLGRINGGYAEKKQALCFAWVESDAERTVEIGAAADWWMEWFVNGERVYSTMDRGNQAPYKVLSHVFRARLRRGRNLVAVKVLSGSAGWRLVSGGPDEVAAARRERKGVRDALRVEVLVDGKLLAREPVPVEVLRPVDRLEGAPAWRDLAPDGQLGEVTNLFKAIPDRARWHKGPADLSGDIWLRVRGRDLVVAVLVRDDVRKPGDACRVQIATGPALGAPRDVPVTSTRDDKDKETLYVATIPRDGIGADRFAVQVRVEDDDWGELKQHATWGAGDEPEAWFQAWLR